MGLTLEKQRKLAHVAQRYYLEDWKKQKGKTGIHRTDVVK